MQNKQEDCKRGHYFAVDCIERWFLKPYTVGKCLVCLVTVYDMRGALKWLSGLVPQSHTHGVAHA